MVESPARYTVAALAHETAANKIVEVVIRMLKRADVITGGS